MSTSSLQKNPIAIIGQAAVFAKAASLDEYWDNILHKIDGITEVPPSRWDPEEYYDPDPGAPDKTYCKRGGFIPPIDFDPLEFGLPPNLLEVTDSSQLLGLVVARDAMEDAGYGLDREFNRQETGVVLGVAGGQKLITDLSARLQYPIWEKVLRNSGISAEDTEIIIDKIKMAYAPWNENSFPGLLGNVIAGRIANRLDLGGMNTVVDAACASSLAAVKAAVSELLEGRAEMMISGGVDTDNSPFTFLCFSKTPAFSPSQQTRPFDAQSDGMLIGEGLGMMVLKRLEDAERDGDRIYAVIRGIGSSSDGKFKSIYAPRPSGQSLAIRRAYQDAGFDPPDIGLVEAHGTGTKAGDPAEFEGLNTIFGSPNGKGQSIAIGSVKSQIGHTKAAAGAAGMIKTALALHYKVLPPTLNVSQPNPALEIENTHFYLNTETRPWFSPNGKGSRKAAVSAFGFGGTNFHLVLEEYPSDAAPVFPSSRTTLPILLSAGTGDQLIRKISGWLERFSADDSRETFLALFRENSSLPEADDHPRLGFAAQNSSEAVQFLETAHKLLSGDPDSGGWDHPHGIIYRRKGLDPDVKTAALFPGQGSQYLNMGLDTVLSFPRMRTSYEAMDELFFSEGLPPLTKKVFPNPALDEATRTAQSAALRETDYAQAGIGVFSYGLYNILSRSGFEPDFTAGHSFGELTALWAGGMMDDQAFLRLVKARGQAMRPPTDGNSADTGTMAAVQAHPDEVKEEIKTFSDVTVANENSPTQTVLAGPTAAVEKAAAELTRKGYKVTQLPVSAAFHTPLVKHASRPFAEAVQAETFQKAKVPVYSNTTGERYPRKLDQAKKILANHILHPVVFKTQIEELYRAGARLFVEIGPRQIMTGLVADILQDQEHTTVALNPSRDKSSERQLIEAVIKLQVLGIPLANDRLLAKNGLITEKIKDLNMDAFKIPLDGSNYVSKERKENFEKALQDDHQVTINRQPSSAQDPERNPEISSEDLGKVSRESESPAQGGNHLLESINLGLSNSFAHQTRTMEVHEQYLEQQGEFAQVFIHILEQGEKLLENSQNGGGERLLESLHQRLDQFQHLQEKGLEVHQQFLGQQADYSQSFVQLLEQQHQVLHQGGNGSASVQKRIDTLDLTSRPAPQRTAAPETPAARQAGGPPAAEQLERSGAGHPAEFPPEKSELTPVPLEELTAVLLEVVGEKTGYPPEMLEMGMDMEADLGIDSIKRVEILGTMEEKYPDLPQPEPDALAELRTLQEIVSYLSREVEGGPDPEPAPSAAPGTAAPVGGDPDPIEKPSAADQSPDVDELTTLLLDVVAEKTGYPAEMLELEMDMEADLGIDSIKRVEILGSMEEQVPELPAFETDKLADLRTLGQIVDYMKQGSPGQEPAGSKEKKKVDTSSLNTEVVRLQPLPEPDFYSFSPPTDRPLIITDDGTTMSADLASKLALSGWHVVLWRYPTNLINTGEGALPDELPVVESAGSDLQQLSEQLARVVQQYGEPAGFIHLHPDSGEDETFSNTDRELVKQVFFLAKHLDPYLNREQAEGRNLFITITQNGGKLGLNGQEFFSQSSGLPGLIKTLRWEWSQVFCRSLDLAVDLPKEEKLSAVIQEIHDPDRSLTEIGISQDGRVTISKEPLHA